MMAYYQMLFTEGTSEEAKVTFHKGLTIYEKEFQKRLPDGPFFGGEIFIVLSGMRFFLLLQEFLLFCFKSQVIFTYFLERKSFKF